jgi:WD40 repeat protein
MSHRISSFKGCRAPEGRGHALLLRALAQTAFAGLLAGYFPGTAYSGDSEFPQTPKIQLPALKTIPPGDEVVLEVGPPDAEEYPGIRIVDLTQAKAYAWDLPREVLDGPAPQGGVQRASWSPLAQELLFAKLNGAYLISKAGRTRSLVIQMPGKLKPFEGVETPALSADGRFIAYYLYTRDAGDPQPDGFGRLYVDLMYQAIEGARPVSLMREVRPSALSWSPNGEKLACATFDAQLIVLDRGGRPRATVQIGAPPDARGIPQGSIYTVRWSPDGTRIGLVYASKSVSGLYTVRPDGTDLQAVKFASPNVDLKSFAWSPDGRRLVFRSYFEGSKTCNYSALGYKFNVGEFPCIYSSNLFTSNADGTNLRKILRKADYHMGELFWIQ